MTSLVGLLMLVVLAIFLGVEVLRWKLRPEQRRLRVIKKIGGGR